MLLLCKAINLAGEYWLFFMDLFLTIFFLFIFLASYFLSLILKNLNLKIVLTFVC